MAVWKSRRSRSASASLVCPSCDTAAGAAERFCNLCGMPLVYDLAEGEQAPLSEAHRRWRKVRREYTAGELVRVGRVAHQAEAEMVQALLLEEGVPSITRRSGGFDVPDFLSAGPRDVLVPRAGAELARELLGGAALGPAAPGAAAWRPRPVVLLLAIAAGGLLSSLAGWVLIHAAG